MDRRSFLVGLSVAATMPLLPRLAVEAPLTIPSVYTDHYTDQLIDSWEALVKLVGNEPEVHKMIATGQIVVRSDLASSPYQVRRKT
jgi:hypothetical protein